MPNVKIMETVLRDSHQSLLATRMSTEDMLPILDSLNDVGYYSMEVWGGATFDACLRFLNEDPWGQTQNYSQPHQEFETSDAVQRSEHSRIPSLCG